MSIQKISDSARVANDLLLLHGPPLFRHRNDDVPRCYCAIIASVRQLCAPRYAIQCPKTSTISVRKFRDDGCVRRCRPGTDSHGGNLEVASVTQRRLVIDGENATLQAGRELHGWASRRADRELSDMELRAARR